MGRKIKVDGNAITGTVDEIADMLQAAAKPVAITNAAIKEGLCNYGYEILKGAGTGDKIPNWKGSNEVHEDMLVAFQKLDVHLALIDDAFKHSRETEQITSLDELAEHPIAGLFSVTGFKVQGSDENLGFIITGDKNVTTGFITLETPKITKSSGYEYFEELEEVIDNCIEEVYQYMNGKYAPKSNQAELDFGGGEKGDNEFDTPID